MPRTSGPLLGAAPHFTSAQITPVLDAQATREGILAGKQGLLAAGPGDEVVVFLAGHGLLDDRLDYYFATTDIDFEKRRRGASLTTTWRDSSTA